ncbi:MAG: adenine deaminase [Anaerolineae bacterium]|nr:adenine deaminase [Anaerolineae bacterium]
MSLNSWEKGRKELIDVALGRSHADMVLQQGIWVSVQSGELIENSDIAIKGRRIAYVGPDAAHTIGPKTKVISAKKRYLIPGLLDAHMHIESGMVTISEFVRAVVPHGTTGMFVDPHEIANVFGIDGVRLMVEEAALQPIHVWVQMPSCVPSAPGLETPGASIGPEEVAEAMQWPGVIGLGEMMNFPGVIEGDAAMLAEMGATFEAGKVIGGHYASPDLGLPFHAYAAGGAEDDHEGTRKEDAAARVRQGMKAMLRLGSAWYDVAEQARAIIEDGLDARHFILCTDDSHSGTLVNDGHMDRVVRHAIEIGLPAMTAIQMATLNTAEHFGLSREIGMIAPGRYADIVLASDLDNLSIDMVVTKGETAYEDDKLLIDPVRYEYPDWVQNSINIKRELTAADFLLPTSSNGRVKANVIGVIENQAPTRHILQEIEVNNGHIHADISLDLAKIALVERHQGNGQIQVGLVSGFGFNQPCGLATTVAHDSHHMIVVGTSEKDMALAANHLAKIGGGQVVVKDGEIIGRVELPIAGLMSAEPAGNVAKKAQTILEGFEACGCTLNNANMQLSLLALVVIPELRISDLGLVDVTKFEIIQVLEQ